jgi:hypothetical protein
MAVMEDRVAMAAKAAMVEVALHPLAAELAATVETAATAAMVELEPTAQTSLSSIPVSTQARRST